MHRTLNDYRLSPEPLDNVAHPKRNFGAGVVIAAIFVSVAAYFFYSPGHSPGHESAAAPDREAEPAAAVIEQVAPPQESTDATTVLSQ